MDTVTSLLIAWLILTLVVFSMSMVNLLGLRSVLDHLRESDPTNWGEDNFVAYGTLASQHSGKLIFLIVFFVEIASLLMGDVRTWLSSNLLLGSLLYLIPLIAATALFAVESFGSKKEAEDPEADAEYEDEAA